MSKTETPDQEQHPSGQTPSETAQSGPKAAVQLDQGSRKPAVPSFRGLMLADDQRGGISVISDRRRNGYLRVGARNTLYRLDGPKAKALLLQHEAERGNHLRPNELREWIDHLSVYAQVARETHDVWLRVAPVADGIEIDVGDEDDHRIRVTPGRVEVTTGSDVFFHRTQATRAFPLPADDGDLRLLDRYLNLSPSDRLLVKAWASYTLAHAKRPGTSYVLLIPGGGQGAGKTFFCRIIQSLVDPSAVGVQTFPRDAREFAVATQLSHLTVYDNVRSLRPEMSDVLCRAATASELAVRKLYTDADVVTLPMHGAFILNGMHTFVDQSDLAQRSLNVTLLPIDERNRRSERALMEEFARDLPRIFRGLLDLIAGVLLHLPDVEPTCPERMIDFVHWLAAMERFHGIPFDPYQQAYSEALRQGMRDSLEENPLAAAVLELVDGVTVTRWSGTPSELLAALRRIVRWWGRSPVDWPKNAISLSKRLTALIPALQRQGVDIRFERGRERRITITRVEGPDHE